MLFNQLVGNESPAFERHFGRDSPWVNRMDVSAGRQHIDTVTDKIAAGPEGI